MRSCRRLRTPARCLAARRSRSCPSTAGSARTLKSTFVPPKGSLPSAPNREVCPREPLRRNRRMTSPTDRPTRPSRSTMQVTDAPPRRSRDSSPSAGSSSSTSRRSRRSACGGPCRGLGRRSTDAVGDRSATCRPPPIRHTRRATVGRGGPRTRRPVGVRTGTVHEVLRSGVRGNRWR